MSAWLNAHRALVEERLRSFFVDKRTKARAIDEALDEPIAELEAFTMRGGKRLRGALAAAAYASVNGGDSLEATTPLGAALELLQSYLLIHDDWMDEDDMRRGGPTAHASLRTRHSRHVADSIAILAGDLASAYAWELLASAGFRSFERAARVFVAAHEDVVLGQHLDVTGSPNTDLAHALKTTSYSVRLPLRLGGLLGGATDAQLAAFDEVAIPLGAAFQLRDDLLGVFGDAAMTGKPSGNDLRAFRKTSVVLDGLAHEGAHGVAKESSPFARVLGDASASDDALLVARAYLVELGTADRIEARIAERAAEAYAILDSAPLTDNGRTELRELVRLLTARTA